MNSEVRFHDYDKAELDRQYNNRLRFANYKQDFESWQRQSAAARDALVSRLDVAYGPDPMERLDIFPAPVMNAPIYVFIHGGYWQSLDKSDLSFVAAGMVPHGITTVVPNYGLGPKYQMDEIVRHNRAAIAWLWKNARELGGDPDRIFVGGHSSGGHLVAMMLATDWPGFAPNLPANLIKGGCAISGLYELEPIRLSYVNDALGMSAEVAARNSPVHQSYPIGAPLIVTVGELESPEYLRQSLMMAALWSRREFPLALRVMDGRDHFTIINDLGDPSAELVRTQLGYFAAPGTASSAPQRLARPRPV